MSVGLGTLGHMAREPKPVVKSHLSRLHHKCEAETGTDDECSLCNSK